MQPEAKYKADIRKRVKPFAYVLGNSNSFTAGIPDHWYSGNKSDLWVEYKFLRKLPKIIDPLDLLSPLQADWLETRHREGRHIAVIIASPHGALIYDGLSWKGAPTSRQHFLDQAEDKKAIAHWIISCVTLSPKSSTPGMTR